MQPKFSVEDKVTANGVEGVIFQVLFKSSPQATQKYIVRGKWDGCRLDYNWTFSEEQLRPLTEGTKEDTLKA